jgi:hypothetical protein
MSHVVTNYQWTWFASGNEADALQTTMAWIGQNSENGWELKGLTSVIAPISHGNVNVWKTSYVAFMQRPIQTTDALSRWNYPG